MLVVIRSTVRVYKFAGVSSGGSGGEMQVLQELDVNKAIDDSKHHSLLGLLSLAGFANLG